MENKRGKIIARRYRNRRIGEFLKELKLTEGRSTGIPGNIKKSIKKLMENNIITQTIPEKPRSKYQKHKLINKKDTNLS